MAIKCNDILLSDIFINNTEVIENVINTLLKSNAGKTYLFEHIIEIITFMKINDYKFSSKCISSLQTIVLQNLHNIPNSRELNLLLPSILKKYLDFQESGIQFRITPTESIVLDAEILSRICLLNERGSNFVNIEHLIHKCATELHKSDFYKAICSLICIKSYLYNLNNRKKILTIQYQFYEQAYAIFNTLRKIIEEPLFQWNIKILNSIK